MLLWVDILYISWSIAVLRMIHGHAYIITGTVILARNLGLNNTRCMSTWAACLKCAECMATHHLLRADLSDRQSCFDDLMTFYL